MQRLASDLSASSAANVTWQVLGNTVVMGPLNTPDVETAIQEQGPLAQTLLSVRTTRVDTRCQIEWISPSLKSDSI